MNKTDEADDGLSSVEATTEESKIIKVIDKSTVHKICSGQVVLSLAVAVKELVENSIDAGATLVEVKLREQGLESIEVSDNGPGVEESNFEGMTAKYHTSKIREFSDLQGVETFGFRGEALSSLCALSDMIITTRHRTAEIGTKLELDRHGKIVKKIPCARQVGTTVTLSNLFSTLPVRKKEFTKNIKKEFTKMCQILQAYCLVAKGVRIICTNSTSKGAKVTFLSTHGSHCVKDNIQSIFGSKQVTDLVEMKSPNSPDEKLSKELLIDLQDPNSSLEINPEDIDKLNLSIFKIEGWISSCTHGSGRSSKDRQYFFVNSRPCEPKNISKIVNDMYHRYNVHQYPFVFLNVIVERSEVDVNITPDKRQLLVNNEKVLLLAIKKSLLNTFGNIPSTFKMQNSFLDSVQQSERDTAAVDSEEEVIMKSDSKKFMAVLSQWKATGCTDQPAKPIKNCKRKPIDEISARNFKLKKIQEYLTQDSEKSVSTKDESFVSCKSDSESDSEVQSTSTNSSLLPKTEEIVADSREFDLLTQSAFPKTLNHNPQEASTSRSNNEAIEAEGQLEETRHVITCKVKPSSSNENIFEEIESIQISAPDPNLNMEKEIVLDSSDNEIQTPAECKTEEITITIDEIKSLALNEQECRNKTKTQSRIDRLKFKSEINPNQNKAAEEELQREISKDMFVKMDIIGQFNHGFIVVRLDKDLFIVDQHATDEKYNFEELQKTTVLQNQKLAIPQSLELTAVNEMILIDNLKVFEANGFKFQIDEEAPVTKKVKLVAKPFSKNWEFGKDDIDELIFMLQDAPPDTMCRPSRIRGMFASRACRKSVMIGKPLSRSIMKRLVTHMGEIEQPWNCPHGRPTMRHLVNLAMLEDKE